MVVIIDGKEILTTNITEIENGQPIFVENLKVHLLAKGNIFSISKRRITGCNKQADDMQDMQDNQDKQIHTGARK